MRSDEQVAQRGQDMLMSAFGEAVVGQLHNDDVVEIMINPDGRLWIERSSGQRCASGVHLGSAQVERVIRLVASHAAKNVDGDAPIISADLLFYGQGRLRFEGLLPPLAEGPCIAIRKHRATAITLQSYAEAGMLDAAQIALLREAVGCRDNILIAGGTGTGKTTLANALLGEVAAHGDRLILIEDTRELHCTADDWVALRTRDDKVTMRDLVRSSLRLRPDRIIVGEVRGGEALDLLKAWNTGHPGGIATIHANDVAGALIRLERLALEATHHVARDLIAEAVDLVILLSGRGRDRRLAEMGRVRGVDREGRFRIDAILNSTRGDPHADSA